LIGALLGVIRAPIGKKTRVEVNSYVCPDSRFIAAPFILFALVLGHSIPLSGSSLSVQLES